MHDCHSSYAESLNRIAVQAGLGINMRPCSKIPIAKRAEGMAQVVVVNTNSSISKLK
jgi:hypothetical protein